MTAESRAARVWLVRERTEHEAASLFTTLAADLASSAAPAQLVELAERCAADERVHAQHCRDIVHALDPLAAPLARGADVVLGSPNASTALASSGARAGRRALYASVALGCVTESLSTALLLELRPRATLEVVRCGLDVILEDEVRHSRLGWAHLAYVAAREDVRWLGQHVPGMLRAALDTEILPSDGAAEHESLVGLGILDRDETRSICDETIRGAILPGLARYGIELRESALTSLTATSSRMPSSSRQTSNGAG